ncbi:MAG: cytochrome d ubiquinol oxidase subunit II [Gammaproteobacteria bacterium]|nr:MAG: cytochrome d ubiquinol oxidase subunit II [Gammaproteobacteria bacterium]
MLLPFLGKKDEERRVIINSIGATWEGNQVWLILGAGAVFAAWPLVYAAAFSGFYTAMLLALFALVIRPVGFTFRSKLPDPRWRNLWDWALFAGGAVPAFIFSVAFGNLLQGVPFQYDDTLRLSFTGSFLALLNPFALLAGLVSVAMLVMHGAVYLTLRTQGEINTRATRAALAFGVIFLVAFALAGVWVALGIDGYRVLYMPDANSAFTPLQKSVERVTGGWLMNYSLYPWTVLAPAAGFAGALAAIMLALRERPGWALLASSTGVSAVVLTAGFAVFPFVMPSSTNPDHSLTLWDGVSSRLTRTWMFWATVIFLPIVIAYTVWVFRVMRGKLTVDDVRQRTHSAY